jgi:hypothetical protein
MQKNGEQDTQRAHSESTAESQDEALALPERAAQPVPESWLAPEFARVTQSAAKFFSEHPAILLTVMYSYTSSAGLFYTWALFQRFGINIADYAQSTDFLLAAFRQPLTLFVAFFGGIVLIGLGYFAYSEGLFSARRFGLLVGLTVGFGAESTRPLAPFIAEATAEAAEAVVGVPRVRKTLARLAWVSPIVMFTGILWSTALLFGFVGGEMVKSGHGSQVVVELKSTGDSDATTTFAGEVFLIGSTERFAFLYDSDDKCAHIVAISNIQHMHVVHVDSVEDSSDATPAAEYRGDRP